MRVVGVIAEYNPLHNGHIYHLERARAVTHADWCVVVMSGNFVQRGEAACTDKFTRTEWALKAGADIVFELPSVYAVSPAERFAMGGVRTLLGTGVVTDLAFGCEETDLQTLYQLSDIITSEPPVYRDALRAHLALGKSYPRARFDALSDYGVPGNMLDAIVQPNNILAIEYLNALHTYAPSIEPLPITRIGTGYNSDEIAGEYASASAIRKAVSEGKRDVLATMPSFVGGPLVFDETFMINDSATGPLMLYAMRRMTLQELRALPDVAEGLENVIYRACREAKSIGEFFELVKSKRYTLARCKRIAVCALLGVTVEHVHSVVAGREGSYLRVLGFHKKARPLLGEIARARSVPLIVRNNEPEDFPLAVMQNLEIDRLSTDVLALATGKDIKRDLTGPVIL